MPDNNATVVPIGTTATVAADQSASDYVVYGTLVDQGSAADIGVGDVPSPPPGIQGPNPEYDPPAVLDVQVGGSATDIEVGNYGQVTVAGSVHSLEEVDYLQSDGVISQATSSVVVAAGGTLDAATLVGGETTIVGTADDLNLTGDDLSVSGAVSGLTFAGYTIPDYQYRPAYATVTRGGLITGADFGGIGGVEVQAGGTLTNSTVAGSLFYPGGDAAFADGGEILTTRNGSTTIDLTATGYGVADLGGYTNGLVVDQNASAFATGIAVNVHVTAASDTAQDLYGLTNAFVYSPQVQPPGAFAGLAVQSRGIAANVVDAGLMAVEQGGTSLDTLITGVQAVYAGGRAYGDVVAQGGTVLNSGSLIYTGANDVTDAGAIVTATIPTAGLAPTSDGATPTPLTFGTGDVVQDGTGVLALDGADSYSGGTVLDDGTIEIGSATGAGTGGIEFTAGHVETLQLDPAAFDGKDFGNALSGLALGSIVDVGRTAFRTGDQAVVQGNELELETRTGALKDRIAIAPGSASGLDFLPLSDQQGGTALFAIPDTLTGVVGGASALAATGSLTQFLSELARDLGGAGSGTSLTAFGFGIVGSDGRTSTLAPSLQHGGSIGTSPVGALASLERVLSPEAIVTTIPRQ